MNVSWMVNDEKVLSEQFRDLLSHLIRGEKNDAIEVLKEANQRRVIRVASEELSKSVVAKIFPLRKVSSQLRYKKYALAEYKNLLLASQRGVPVPFPYGYVENQRYYLVKSCAVIMEDFPDWQTLKDVALREGPLIAARLALNPLAACYETGCHNLDLRDENILVSPGRDSFVVIDWQYAVFTKPRASGLLECLVAHYLKKLEPGSRVALVESWLPELSLLPGVPPNLENAVQKLVGKRLSLWARKSRKIE